MSSNFHAISSETGEEFLMSTGWKDRLHRAFYGILLWSNEYDNPASEECWLRARSIDVGVLLEVREREGFLAEASIQIALPKLDELEALKIGCWKLLFLRSFFPKWKSADAWCAEATREAEATGLSSIRMMRDHRVSCHFDSFAKVLDYRVIRTTRSETLDAGSPSEPN